ncbi:MAG: mandelate racemase/muconate lactonizing enzyme family protein [Desulfitobacteriia bacterium]|jgi:D-galactarolactone cycloisomerase
MKKMKISSVIAMPLSYPVPEENQIRLGTGKMVKRDAVVVRVEADGFVGYGEAHHAYAPRTIANLINDTLSELVVGQDPFAIEDLWFSLYRQHVASHGTGTAAVIAISGIEIAILDLIGKALGIPLYKYLGGKKKKIRAYAGGLSLGWQEPEQLVDEVSKYMEMGYSAIKLRGGDRNNNDLRRAVKVREKVGDKVDLMIDANTRYTLGQAHYAIREFERLGFLWLEEPFTPDANEEMALLNRMTSVLIAAGENHYTRYEFRKLLTAGAIGVVQADCTKAGGILECKKIAEMADAFHVLMAPHTSQTALSTAATIHLLCSIPNAWFYEADLMMGNPYRDLLVENPLKVEGGLIEPNDEPGLGVHVREEFFDQYPAIDGPCYVI